MEDISLVAKIDENTTIYVSPMHETTYSEFVDRDNLGGPGGYFIARQRRGEFQILAKAANLDTAREIFAMLASSAKFPRVAA